MLGCGKSRAHLSFLGGLIRTSGACCQIANWRKTFLINIKNRNILSGWFYLIDRIRNRSPKSIVSEINSLELQFQPIDNLELTRWHNSDYQTISEISSEGKIPYDKKQAPKYVVWTTPISWQSSKSIVWTSPIGPFFSNNAFTDFFLFPKKQGKRETCPNLGNSAEGQIFGTLRIPILDKTSLKKSKYKILR